MKSGSKEIKNSVLNVFSGHLGNFNMNRILDGIFGS